MPSFALLLLRIGLVAGVLLTVGVSALPAQERVGVNSAVNPEATGALPGAAAPRRLVIGQDVIFNEHITTGDTGQTQLLFLDESSMTIGPNSDLTIDQFAYDPKTGTGKLAMSATRGLLRYVGGKLSKQDNAVTLRTATATLAVRGGVFIAQIRPNGATEVVFLFGKSLTITGLAGGIQTVVRPGYQSTISPGGAPSPPAPQPPGQLAQFNQELNGQTGGTGGATTIPTDTNVVNSGISQTISGNITQSVQQSVQNLATATTTSSSTTTTASSSTTTTNSLVNNAPSTTPAVPPPPTTTTINASPPVATFSNGTLSNGTFTGTIGGSSFSFPLATGITTFSATGSSPDGAVSGGSFLSSDGAYFFADLKAAGGQGFFVSGGIAVPSSVLAATGATRIFAFSVAAPPSPASLYLVAPASTAIGDTSTASAARMLHAAITFSGTGSGQSSSAGVQTGTVSTQSGAPIIKGVLRGVEVSGAGAASQTVTTPLGSVVDASGNSLYGTNTISGFTLSQTPSTAVTTGGVSLSSNLIPSFSQPAVATALPTGVGTNRTSQTLSGFFGGTMTTTAQSTPPYSITGAANIATDSNANTLKATFTSDTLASSTTGGVTSVVMNFGGSQSAFIDNNIFGAAEDPAAPQQINGQQLTVGGNTAQASILYLVSSGSTPLPTSLFPNGVPSYQYLQWGYWGGDLLTGNSTDNNLSRIDHGHINFWVAGMPTVTMPTTGIGSFNGHAIGSVFNGGANYVAAGSFSGTYSFATQSFSAFAINNFDGNSFSGTGGNGSSGKYTLPLAQTGGAGTINGTTNGAFFGPNAAETGGNFSLQATTGPIYRAAGIFAGKQ